MIRREFTALDAVAPVLPAQNAPAVTDIADRRERFVDRPLIDRLSGCHASA